MSNPLLETSTLPSEAPAFDTVKTEHFLPAIKEGIAQAEKEIAAIKNNKAAPTFANTIEALEFSGVTLGRAYSLFSHLVNVNADDENRAIEEEIELLSTRHFTNVSMDAGLFARIKAVYDQKDALDLSPEQAKLLEKTYKGFVRGGALLGDNAKEELRAINEKLSELTTKFRTNDTKATAAYQKVIDDETDLKGLPPRALNLYKAAAEEAGLPGKFLIKLSPPPTDIFAYCENRALREEIHKAFANTAWHDAYDNCGNVIEIVKLRERAAKLLGFATHADFVLDNRMAGSPKAVEAMLEKNLSVYKPKAEEFLQKVKDYAAKTDGVTDLKPWDLSFYSRRLKEETYKLSMEEVRPYFDLEKVTEGVRKHAEKLFNVSLTEAKGKYPVYHEDVKVYEVSDKKTGALIGVFYTDYYARPGAKRNGAWMDALRGKGLENGQDKVPVVFNVCNFPKPTADQPTLLSIDQVTTVFHEFGHGLHGLLAEGKYASLTGTNVKWDFVEVPSQLQENWVGEKEVLDTFAAHYKTGEKIPAELVKKLDDVQNFDAAYAGLRQTFLGLLDMAWHTADPSKIKSVEEFEDAIGARASLFPRLAGPMSTSFSHIFAGGYAAGYYSYKWAEVLEADIFAAFKKAGLYNQELAEKLRETVYSKGGTVEPGDLFRKLMGREPDADALFRREGLLPENDNSSKQAPQQKKGPAPK